MSLLTESQVNFARPIARQGFPAMKQNTCLNVCQYDYQLMLIVVPNLGIISRVMLAFNKRGLVVQDLHFRQLDEPGRAAIQLKFAADAEQLRLVRNDLAKLYDLVQLLPVAEDIHSND